METCAAAADTMSGAVPVRADVDLYADLRPTQLGHDLLGALAAMLTSDDVRSAYG
jgi:hypothetical protein